MLCVPVWCVAEGVRGREGEELCVGFVRLRACWWGRLGAGGQQGVVGCGSKRSTTQGKRIVCVIVSNCVYTGVLILGHKSRFTVVEAAVYGRVRGRMRTRKIIKCCMGCA
jgi:hypothetical protein